MVYTHRILASGEVGHPLFDLVRQDWVLGRDDATRQGGGDVQNNDGAVDGAGGLLQVLLGERVWLLDDGFADASDLCSGKRSNDRKSRKD